MYLKCEDRDGQNRLVEGLNQIGDFISSMQEELLQLEAACSLDESEWNLVCKIVWQSVQQPIGKAVAQAGSHSYMSYVWFVCNVVPGADAHRPVPV